MKKVLLFGNLNSVLQNISESLSEYFSVQLASENPDIARDLIKMTKPDLIVFCQVGVEKDIELLDVLCESVKKRRTPILGIATVEGKAHFDDYMNKISNLEYLTRPITKFGLIKTCKRIMGLEIETEETEKSAAVEYQGEKPLVLIVDDSELALRRLERLLAKKYRTLTVNDGRDALKIIQDKKPDLVLLDYNMPGWDGTKTLDMIKKQPGGDMIPVIFLTGVAEREQIYKALELNPHGYVLKPPVPEVLFERIDDALSI